MSGRLKSLHSCRKSLNTGKARYFDKEKTMPLADPSQCEDDYKAAGKITKAGESARKLVEKKCTNADLEALSACDITVDAVISADGTMGCLPATAIAASDALIEAQYGRALDASESGENSCQAAVASAGSSYATARSKALRGCRNDLNKGTALFTDEAETNPVTDPAQCASEVGAASDIVKAGEKMRSKVEGSCSDPLVSSLSSTCGSTVDGLVNVAGTGGCLVSSGNSAVSALLDAAY
jgi:hypothetical protein